MTEGWEGWGVQCVFLHVLLTQQGSTRLPVNKVDKINSETYRGHPYLILLHPLCFSSPHTFIVNVSVLKATVTTIITASGAV